MIRSILYLFIFSISFSSCVTKRKVTYMQGTLPDSSWKEQQDYRLQPGDQLMVEVRSLDPSSNQYFNSYPEVYNEASIFLNSYSVNDSGMMDLPIGKFYVKGLTVQEVQEKIYSQVNQRMKALVFVKLTGFEVTILGEVVHPGTYRVYGDKVSLLSAIGRAGDLTDFGNRKKIKLIRMEESSYRTFEYDITKNDFLFSDGNMLRPNDVIYVESMKLKFINQNLTPLRTLFIGISSLFIIIRFVRLN